MTPTEIIYRRRLAALEHATQTGTVAHTCPVFGISRKTSYEWRNLARSYGVQATCGVDTPASTAAGIGCRFSPNLRDVTRVVAGDRQDEPLPQQVHGIDDPGGVDGQDGRLGCDRMLRRLRASRLDNRHDVERKLLRLDLLVIDDFALQPLDAADTHRHLRADRRATGPRPPS